MMSQYNMTKEREGFKNGSVKHRRDLLTVTSGRQRTLFYFPFNLCLMCKLAEFVIAISTELGPMQRKWKNRNLINTQKKV